MAGPIAPDGLDRTPDRSAPASTPAPTPGVTRVGARLPAAAVVFGGNLVARGLGFLFPVVLANILERPDFAVAMFLINTGFFAGELVLTGYPTALTRVLASARPGTPRATWIVASVAGGIPLLILSIGLGALLAVRGAAPAGLLALVIVGLTIDAYYFALLRGLRRFGWLAIYRVGANLAQLLLIVALAAVGGSGPSLAVVVTVYSLVYLVPIVAIELVDGPARQALAGRAGPGVRLLDPARVVDLTRFAIPALVSGTAYGAILGFDVFFVRIFAPDALADYAAARSLALPMLLVPFALSVVLLPQVAAAPDREVGRLLRRALTIAVAAAAAAWVAWAVVGASVIGVVLPASYAEAEAPLATLVPAVGLVGVYSIMSGWMLGIGRPWTTAACLATGALVTLAGHVTITARLGAVGAGMAIGLGAGTALALVGFAAWRVLRSGSIHATGRGAI